jgi:hypothetical protein
MKASDKPTPFVNVQVTAIPVKDQSTGKTSYNVHFDPASLVVSVFDTVIAYQLVGPTPADVVFKSVKVKPGQEDQLSTPSISESGKLVTFSDANTRQVDFRLTFHFADDAQHEFSVDPEVVNQPPPELEAAVFAKEAMLMPEVQNTPPPEN